MLCVVISGGRGGLVRPCVKWCLGDVQLQQLQPTHGITPGLARSPFLILDSVIEQEFQRQFHRAVCLPALGVINPLAQALLSTPNRHFGSRFPSYRCNHSYYFHQDLTYFHLPVSITVCCASCAHFLCPPPVTTLFIREVQGVVAGATENKGFLISSPVGIEGLCGAPVQRNLMEIKKKAAQSSATQHKCCTAEISQSVISGNEFLF